MKKMILAKIVNLLDDRTKGKNKTRTSGTSTFPAPQQNDIGRVVIVTRECLTWTGVLGYFESDDDKEKYAFAQEELIEAKHNSEIVGIKEFGKDHWSLLGYLETVCVDSLVHIGNFNRTKIRGNTERHFKHCSSFQKAHGWTPDHGTRLKGFFLEDKKTDKSRKLGWHDDWDCLNDLEAAGLIAIKDIGKCEIMLTEKGMKVAGKLRTHKAKGGFFANFEYEGK